MVLTMGATWLDAENMRTPWHRWICAATFITCCPPSCGLQSRSLKVKRWHCGDLTCSRRGTLSMTQVW